jgi:hypothetical protein
MAEDKTETGCMTLDVQVGERVRIGDVSVELLHKTGRYARMRIRAPRSVPIKRQAGATDARGSVPSMAECEPD